MKQNTAHNPAGLTDRQVMHVFDALQRGFASAAIASKVGREIAAHGLHRPTQERPVPAPPAGEPTGRWCSDPGKVSANVTGKSALADRLHPSSALGLTSTEAADRWSGRLTGHPAVAMGAAK